MTNLVNHSRKDDAVSPVVGVMLMLVVTIVIAAVVALFATSVVTETKAAPVSVIQMNAYCGDSAVNQNLVMSTLGGEPLELATLKTVVSIEDGKYGLVFKKMDSDPVVGKFLEIGEQLEIFNFSDSGMDKLNSVVGASWDDKQTVIDKILEAWAVGNKINVMVVFNEDAILYDKDIIIQDGIHGYKVSVDAKQTDAAWTMNGQALPSNLSIEWSESNVAVSKAVTNGTAVAWNVNIADTSGSGSIDLQVLPEEGKVITGIQVNGGEPLGDKDETIVRNSNLTLLAVVEEEKADANIFIKLKNDRSDQGNPTLTVTDAGSGTTLCAIGVGEIKGISITEPKTIHVLYTSDLEHSCGTGLIQITYTKKDGSTADLYIEESYHGFNTDISITEEVLSSIKDGDAENENILVRVW